MKVETEQLDQGEIALSFEVEDARVERAMDAAYRRVANRVDIAGFRRGKAPRPLVERVIGRESLMQEALNQLLPEVYEEALRETNIQAISEPEFDVESLSPFRAKATVLVQPNVALGAYESIKREPTSVTVSEDEIAGVLQQLRERHAEWVPTDQAAAAGDRVTIDVSGYANGEEVVSQEDVDYVLDLEGSTPIPGFAEKLVGATAGETREFRLAVPSEDMAEKLAGKEIDFTVTVKDVKAKDLPELDDYFAATVGTYKDLGELRADVERQLRERAEATAERSLRDEIVDEAVAMATVELSDKLIDYHAHRSWDRLGRDLDSRGLTIEQYARFRRMSEDDLRSEVRAESERTLRRDLVLRSIASAQQLDVSDEDVDAGVRAVLSADGADDRAIARALRSAEIRDRVRSTLRESRAVQWLVDHAVRESAPVPAGDPEEEGDRA
ncbi:MAG TPA: trigger factor [Chloroflexota bacterium]|nr:trigger factor [Chloroflexota bacterium]